MRTIRVGVIGSGFMGAAHVEALRRVPGVEVAAIASIDTPKARELSEQFAIPIVHEDWQGIVADSTIEAVHNTTPNNLHYEINKALLEAGKHVLSEKPLTMTSAESTVLVDLAKRSGLVTGINFNYRGYPLIQHARALVRRGDVGRIFNVHGHYIQDWLLYDTDYNWRIDTEISGASRTVADIGSHWCDLVQFITGLKIKRVFGDLFTVHPTRKKPRTTVESFKGLGEGPAAEYDEVEIDTEDAANVLVQFEGGARGSFTVSQISAGRKNRQWFQIDGSKKALSWDQEHPNSLWIGSRDEPNGVLIKDPSLLAPEAKSFAHYPGGHPEGYPDGPKNLFTKFYNFIRDGKKPGVDEAGFPTFVDGDWEVRMVEAVLQSHREQRWVDVG